MMEAIGPHHHTAVIGRGRPPTVAQCRHISLMLFLHFCDAANVLGFFFVDLHRPASKKESHRPTPPRRYTTTGRSWYVDDTALKMNGLRSRLVSRPHYYSRRESLRRPQFFFSPPSSDPTIQSERRFFERRRRASVRCLLNKHSVFRVSRREAQSRIPITKKNTAHIRLFFPFFPDRSLSSAHTFPPKTNAILFSDRAPPAYTVESERIYIHAFERSPIFTIALSAF